MKSVRKKETLEEFLSKIEDLNAGVATITVNPSASIGGASVISQSAPSSPTAGNVTLPDGQKIIGERALMIYACAACSLVWSVIYKFAFHSIQFSFQLLLQPSTYLVDRAGRRQPLEV